MSDNLLYTSLPWVSTSSWSVNKNFRILLETEMDTYDLFYDPEKGFYDPEKGFHVLEKGFYDLEKDFHDLEKGFYDLEKDSCYRDGHECDGYLDFFDHDHWWTGPFDHANERD